MNQIYEKLVKCADAVKSKIKFQPKVALILGSGLGDYAETMQVEETMEYTEIEGFPVSTVAGHKGRFLFGYIQMDLLGHAFFVFCNAETDEVNVVYKRKDGSFGLIEPEFS